MEKDYLNIVKVNIIKAILLKVKKKEKENCICEMVDLLLDLLLMEDPMVLVFLIMELILKEKLNLMMEK